MHFKRIMIFLTVAAISPLASGADALILAAKDYTTQKQEVLNKAKLHEKNRQLHEMENNILKKHSETHHDIIKKI